MGLYLCIFTEDGEDEIAGHEVGHYSDFGWFRDTIAKHLRAPDYPVLMQHSDSDGEWSVTELPSLARELESIATAFRALPPEEPQGAFEHTAEYRADAQSLYDCFHTPDGENLFEALIDLCQQGIQAQRPITFQ